MEAVARAVKQLSRAIIDLTLELMAKDMAFLRSEAERLELRSLNPHPTKAALVEGIVKATFDLN